MIKTKKVRFSLYMIMIFVMFFSVVPTYALDNGTKTNATEFQATTAADAVNQTITAYRCNQGDTCASGAVPYQGAVAVHSSVIGNPFHPIYPFGSMITLTQSVPMYGGGSRSSFTVEDTGQLDHKDYNAGVLTWGWLDTWQGYGPIGGTVYNWCINTFGTLRRDYNVN